jgi:restriction system protein
MTLKNRLRILRKLSVLVRNLRPMPIPDFQTLMRPLLLAHADGNEHLNRDLVAQLADQFELTEEERREMLPSGGARLFDNRIGWAKSHIMQAGLLTAPRRAISIITPLGQKALLDNTERIDLRVLQGYESYLEFRNRRKTDEESTPAIEQVEDSQTPEEILENAYLQVRRQIESDLLAQIMSSPPDFLERVVVDLVVRMGYGGSRKDAGKALGRSGDEGIDGIINEDPLGLDVIYLQAKRWEGSVGRPEIQKFAGALQGQRAKKGIFITTSSFTAEAREFASRIETKIILIDGQLLAKLMFDHNVGVASASNYEVKKIDSDYFNDA